MFIVAVTLASLAASPISFTHEAMGTIFEIKSFSDDVPHLQNIVQECFSSIDTLEQQISSWRSDSEVSYVNNNAAKRPVSVSGGLFDLLAYCRTIYEETNGAFDPTVGPLLEIWGFYRKEARLPPESEIQNALERIGMDKVILDKQNKTVQFSRDYMRLDFGGIGKGLAVDRAADILKGRGITSTIISAGTSSIMGLGAPPGESGWLVRISDPSDQKKTLDDAVLKDLSISTSGCYANFLEVKGKKYCHIFDPRTGHPVEGILSASAIAPTAIQADALSTAFFVMGIEKTAVFCKANPSVRAVVVPMINELPQKPVRIP